MNAIEIRNLNFYYGSYQGLKNINLDIEEKEVTAFIGPSGCGKSTLLRSLNRMYDLYPGQRAEGEINFYGENILEPKRDLNLLRSRIGMVFQKPTPFPMSIYENIAFGVEKNDIDIENQLMFAGHNAYRFATDSFYDKGFIPTIKELVDRIMTGK